MKVIDLRKYGQNSVSFYLALEQIYLESNDDDIFFLWDISQSIVIGRHQLLNNEVNLPYAKKNNIKVYRRPSGGGAIYADDGCFMYSFVTNVFQYDTIYQNYLPMIVSVFKKLGLKVYFSGRNDLMFKNKKISGTAIYQTNKASIMHGTLLYDTNIAHLVEALTVDQTKILSKGIKSVSQRVINLKPYLTLSKHELMDYILETIGGTIVEISSKDYQAAKELEQKYLSDEWIIGKNPKHTFQNKKYFPFGSLAVYLLIKNNKISEVVFKGDFFEKKPLDELYTSLMEVDVQYEAIKQVLDKYPLGNYIEKANNENLLELLFKEEKGNEKNGIV